MTPERRAALIARAKAKAIPVASCVAARLRPDHLRLDAMSRAELVALVLVLAAAVDPVALRTVVAEDDDGLPGPSGRDLLLRQAHAECVRLRAAGESPPLRLRLLEAEYQTARRKPAGGAGGLLAQIRSEESRRGARTAAARTAGDDRQRGEAA